MEILVTVDDFLKNGGKLTDNMTLYKNDGKLLGYFLKAHFTDNKFYYYNTIVKKALFDIDIIKIKIKVQPIYD